MVGVGIPHLRQENRLPHSEPLDFPRVSLTARAAAFGPGVGRTCLWDGRLGRTATTIPSYSSYRMGRSDGSGSG